MRISLIVSHESGYIEFISSKTRAPHDYTKLKLNLNQIEAVLKEKLGVVCGIDYSNSRSLDLGYSMPILRTIIREKKVKTVWEYEFLLGRNDYNLYQLLKSNSVMSMKTFQKMHKIQAIFQTLGTSSTRAIINELLAKEKELYG